MKQDISIKLMMFFLIMFLLGLSLWAILAVEKTEHQIAIFGIVGAIIAAMTSVYSVMLNNYNIKERELELIVIKEKQKVFEHFYNAYFEILKTIKNKPSNKSSTNVEKEILEFKRGLMNWGSERLIKKYLEYDAKMIQGTNNKDTNSILKDGYQFIKDLRKEMGFNDSDNVNIMSIILTAEAREKLEKS